MFVLDYFEEYAEYLFSNGKCTIGPDQTWVVNVEALLGNKEKLGNGDINEGYTDVYLLVESSDENFNSEEYDVYDLIYCKSENSAENRTIGKLQFYRDGVEIILTPEEDMIMQG